MMLTGFSVGIYGIGSKISVLDGIQGILQQDMSGDVVIRIRGYDQTFPLIRTIAAAITKAKSPIRTQQDLLRAVEMMKTKKVFLLIDSIDAVPMRNNQELFSNLASLPHVKICATVDHSKVGLLWNPPQLKRFAWYWVEASTYRRYENEIRDTIGFWESVVEGKIEANSKTLSVVLQSLTGNHKDMVKLIATMQLAGVEVGKGKRPADQQVVQIRSIDLLRRCKKDMIATNLPKMRQLMQELLDHRIVMEAKEKETGNEVFWLPFDTEMLENISRNEFA